MMGQPCQVLLDEILGFVVYNENAQNGLQKILDAQNSPKKIKVVPEWYYS